MERKRKGRGFNRFFEGRADFGKRRDRVGQFRASGCYVSARIELVRCEISRPAVSGL